MNDVITVVFIALVCVAAGFAFGMLWSNVRSDRNRQAPSGTKSGANVSEVVKVVQDRKTGNIYPEINGKVIRYPADMSATQHERLAIQLGVVQAWLQASSAGKSASSASAVKAEAGAAVASEAPESGTPAASMPAGEALPAPTSAPAASLLPKAPPPQAPRISPVDMVARALQAEVKNPAPVDKSIAAQIDEILQEKMVGSPLAGRGIRLMELPSKGLVVMVGLDQYAGVEEVPDPEIKALIRTSVEEWERRASEA